LFGEFTVAQLTALTIIVVGVMLQAKFRTSVVEPAPYLSSPAPIPKPKAKAAR